MTKTIKLPHHNPPEALRKKGIMRATSNLNGREIQLPRGTLFTFFRKELTERFMRPASTRDANPTDITPDPATDE